MKRLTGRFGQTVLGLLGLGLFCFLVYRSGVSWHDLKKLSVTSLLGFSLASIISFLFDVWGWQCSFIHHRPPFLSLVRIHLAGEAFTRAVPGGFVVGEPYKIAQLYRRYAIPVAESSVSLVLLRLGVGLSQTLFILSGLALGYPILRDHSAETLGFSGAHLIGLGVTLLMAIFLLLFGAMLWRGRTLHALVSVVRKILPLRFTEWISRHDSAIAAIDQQFAVVIGQRRRQLVVLSLLFCSWLFLAVESWILFNALAPPVSGTTAYGIESMSSLFRLIFFLIPLGLGGQDISVIGLCRLYHLPPVTAGSFILIKRLKDAIWIGAGFVMLLLNSKWRGNPPDSKSNLAL